MNLRSADNSKSRFAAYVEGLVSVIGHADRAGPLRDYCLGLIMPCERKSVEPMAAVTAPDRTAAQHQSLLHFVGQSPWSDEKVLAKVGEMVLPAIESQGPIEAWIIDDTGFPKKGEHSVGVARQYCGQLGKRENCQVAVSLSLANHDASLPVAWRLYLPKERAADLEHRRKAGVVLIVNSVPLAQSRELGDAPSHGGYVQTDLVGGHRALQITSLSRGGDRGAAPPAQCAAQKIDDAARL